MKWGVTPVMTYDPLGRQIRVDLPDGTFQTVVYDPWRVDAHPPSGQTPPERSPSMRHRPAQRRTTVSSALREQPAAP